MLPSYLEKLTIIDLRERSEKLNALMESCTICPNECGTNRITEDTGKCCSSAKVLVSSISPHFGEEPPLVGKCGSGTIFFTNCNLKCVFCQNYDISHLGNGREISIEQLGDAMIQLQNKGCHNINFVTPTHFTPQIISALAIAVEKGLEIPIVYNCGGYESVETLKLLDGIIDIYMPDIKYSSNEIAFKYSGVKNYWTKVKAAVLEMYRQVGHLKISNSGIAKRGLLIRHLVLPNDLAGSREVINFIAEEISKDSYVNIMDQYRPAHQAHKHSELNRVITSDEYYQVINWAEEAGLHRGFVEK
ncbi:MAG: radical SAM protein [Bacteroidota bacterium]